MKTTAGIFLINKHKQILTCHPTRHSPTQWDIPKGCFDEDDVDLENTVARELFEETGLDIDMLSGNLIDVSKEHGTFVYKHKKKQLHAFLLVMDNDIDVRTMKCSSMVTSMGDPFPEVDSYAWMNMTEMMLLHETQQKAICLIEKVYNVFGTIDYRGASTDQTIRAMKSNLYG